MAVPLTRRPAAAPSPRRQIPARTMIRWISSGSRRSRSAVTTSTSRTACRLQAADPVPGVPVPGRSMTAPRTSTWAMSPGRPVPTTAAWTSPTPCSGTVAPTTTPPTATSAPRRRGRGLRRLSRGSRPGPGPCDRRAADQRGCAAPGRSARARPAASPTAAGPHPLGQGRTSSSSRRQLGSSTRGTPSWTARRSFSAPAPGPLVTTTPVRPHGEPLLSVDDQQLRCSSTGFRPELPRTHLSAGPPEHQGAGRVTPR